MNAASLPLDHPFAHHNGFNRVFAPDRLTLGFILPVASYPNEPGPSLEHHAELTQLADQLGFAALWARDVPFYDPGFGDMGQVFEAFTYLGFLAGTTKRITLATGSAVITLRHPLHLAKMAASVDQLSSGRLVLGIASGDRPVEYPAFGLEDEYEQRGDRFREAFEMFRLASETPFPNGDFDRFGDLQGLADLVPKPFNGRIPAFVTGRSRQAMDWIAANADGWFYYFIGVEHVSAITTLWRETIKRVTGEETFKPFAQGMFFDLAEDPDQPPMPIHAGLRIGRRYLVDYLEHMQRRGVNHAALNLKSSRRPAKEVVQELAEYVLPHFPSHEPLEP